MNVSNADAHVFAHPLRDGLGVADQGGSSAAAHQADAGPQIGTDLEFVPPSAVECGHTALPYRIHPFEHLLRRRDRNRTGLPGDGISASPSLRSLSRRGVRK